jgi:hypothetical protein
VALALCLAALLLLPGAAGATSISEVGGSEGVPTSINASDQMVIGGELVIEENETTHELEENIEEPWSIWNGSKAVHVEPLNGEPNGESESLDHEHNLFLYNINASGQAGGSSTITTSGSGENEKTTHRAVWVSPAGEVHEVPLLQAELQREPSEGVFESFPAGSLGTGIDDAGDVVGIGVEEIKVDNKPKAGGRGFFDRSGTASPPEVVGEADKPGSGEWDSEVIDVNGSGTMFGVVAASNSEGDLENPHYYLWKSPGEVGTVLNFDAPLAGFGLASDGSVLGYVAGTLMLREPNGTETEVAGLSKPFAMNSSHQVIGSETVSGVEHAAVWQAKTVTDLNTELPEGSGWVLNRATAINDNGDIAGIGTHEGHPRVFLFKPGLVVTSSKDSKESPTASSGVCATEKDGCTLRAAIETVNKAKKDSPTSVTFNVAGGKAVELKPESALPAIAAPINIEGGSQPGALEESAGEGRKIGVVIDGTKAGPNGLELETTAGESTISGVSIQKFSGDGVLLKGEHQHEVAGSNDVVGRYEELAGNDFVADGDTSGFAGYLQSLGSKKATPAENAEAIAAFGAGVYIGTGATSGTQITGNLIGLQGGLKSLAPNPSISTAGVLIDPASGNTSSVTIGGPGASKNLISGDVMGVDVLGSRGGGASVSAVTIVGNQIGGDRGNPGESELGTIIGLLSDGKVASLQVGTGTEGNTFPADIIGITLEGTELSAASVQGNKLGVDKGISSFEGGKLEGHDIIGIIAADTSGVTIGGAAGQGNKVLGAPIGIAVAGKHSTGNRVESNTIGRAAPPSGPFDLSEKSFDPGEFAGIFGLLELGGSKQQIGSSGAGNTIQGNLVGAFSVEETDDTVQGNSFLKNAFSVFDLGSGGIQFGGSGGGQGNQVASSAIGLFMANVDPTKQELETAQSGEKPASEEVRDHTLKETQGETEALDEINGTSTAELTEAGLKVPSKPGTNNRIEGNLIGTDAGGNTKSGSEPLGNTIGVLIAGDEHGVIVGGTGAGQGNQIVNGGSGGLLMAGSAAHAPTVQVLGNKIYNNSTFGGLAQGLPGLGLSLIRVQGSGEVDPVYGLSVNPQDPMQPDQGPNSLQNSPVLTSATISAGQLVVAGTLQSVPNTSYTIELFSDEFKSPYGAGEGQQSLGRFNLQTDASGHASFSAAEPAPGPNFQYVSATATTLPGGESGVTSEFAVDAKIQAGPEGSKPGPGPTSPSTTSSTPTGAVTTGIIEHSGALTVTVSAVKFTLPGVTVECASTSTGCSASATATQGTASASSASVASTHKSKKKHAKAPVVLARWSASIPAGHSTPVQLTLTSQGKALLAHKHSLTLTVLISVKATNAKATTRTLHVHILQAKAKHGAHKRK